MKILVISGFLGAGKTTFIQELVRRTGRDFAIYENEYGEADIDARRLTCAYGNPSRIASAARVNRILPQAS